MVFLMTDGLDGVGKGEVLSAIVEYERETGRRTFDCNNWWGDLNNPSFDYNPRASDIPKGSLLISAEPTFAGIGRRIRSEYISKNKRDYDPRVIAEAYALDRHELYTTTLLPVLSRGDDVIQSRGVVTSLVYQMLDSADRSTQGGMDVSEIMDLAGNKFALSHVPTVLVIPTITDIDGLMARLDTREKKDNAIFETLDFQRRLKPLYESAWLREIFESRGCSVEFIDAGISVVETRRQAVEVWKLYKRREDNEQK